LAKVLNSSVFLVEAVCAATDEELETGIEPAVFNWSGKTNFSSPFSKRNKATSLGRTPKNLETAARNVSGVSACAKANSTEDLLARAGAAAVPEVEFNFPAIW